MYPKVGAEISPAFRALRVSRRRSRRTCNGAEGRTRRRLLCIGERVPMSPLNSCALRTKSRCAATCSGHACSSYAATVSSRWTETLAQTARLHRWRDRAIACHFLAALERPKEPNPSPRLAAIPSSGVEFVRFSRAAGARARDCSAAADPCARRQSRPPRCPPGAAPVGSRRTGPQAGRPVRTATPGRTSRPRCRSSHAAGSTARRPARHRSSRAPTPATPELPPRLPLWGRQPVRRRRRGTRRVRNGVGGATTALIVRGWQQPVRHGADFRTPDTQRHSPGGFPRGGEGMPPSRPGRHVRGGRNTPEVCICWRHSPNYRWKSWASPRLRATPTTGSSSVSVRLRPSAPWGQSWSPSLGRVCAPNDAHRRSHSRCSNRPPK